MKVLRILLKAPGGWTSGLDSCVRGEGRWALNIARSLALMGHTVYAWSGGDPDRKYHSGVHLLSCAEASQLTDIDVYIDGGMYDGEIAPVTSKLEMTAFWNMEPRLLKALPANRIIVYPYATSKVNFHIPENPNIGSTFFLPAPFTWDDPKPIRRSDNRDSRIFSTLRLPTYGLQDIQGTSAALIGEYFQQAFGRSDEEKHLIVFPESSIQELQRNQVLGSGSITLYTAIAYNRLREIIRYCDINIPILTPASILDATFEGTPTVIFEKGGFFTSVAEAHGLLVKKDTSAIEFGNIKETLLRDDQIRTKYLRDLQDFLSDHTHYKFVQHFNQICKARDIL